MSPQLFRIQGPVLLVSNKIYFSNRFFIFFLKVVGYSKSQILISTKSTSNFLKVGM